MTRQIDLAPVRWSRATAIAFALYGLACLGAACGSNPEKPAEETAAAAAPATAVDSLLPALGDVVVDYPEGEGQGTAQRSCGSCHSSDIIRQQRLTEAQWTASVDKMVRWGAVVPDAENSALVAYLARHYGPDNTGFTPVVTRPVGE